jgi:hypothetical protein
MSLKLFRGTLANLPASLAEGEIAWVTDDPNQALYVGNSTGNIKFSPASAGAAGDVVGPGGATDDNIATFDGTSGKLIQDSGVDVADIGLNSAHRVVVTGNPHAVTFTEAVAEDGATDISAAEAETLTDGSNADALHVHAITATPSFDWIDFDLTQSPAPSRQEGRVWYDPDLNALSLYVAGSEVTQTIGHELYTTVYNDTLVDIQNGEAVVIDRTSAIPGAVTLADASDADLSIGTLGLATELIEAGTVGMVTQFGAVRDVDTSLWTIGTELYLSDTVPGGLTDTTVQSPSYDIGIGIVATQHATLGIIGVRPSSRGNTQGTFRLVNGCCLEGYSTAITSNGTIVTCTLNSDTGEDLSLMFNEEIHVFPEPASVSLTPGTDAVPVLNYVFIPEDTLTLTANTTGFPSGDYQPVGQYFCQTAASVLADSILKHHAWNDHLGDVDENGHISDLNFWVRNQHSTWLTGCAPSITDGANTYFDVTAGTALQLHVNPCNALSMTLGHPVYIVNDSVATYKRETDLNNVILDSEGVTLNNKYFKLVFLEVVNSDGDGQILVNLPSGSYNSIANADADLSGYADFSLPAEFKGVGFLVASCVFRLSGGVQTAEPLLDLRGAAIGTISGGVAGGGTGGGTIFPDNTFRVQNLADPTKELAFDLSGVTSGNVRTIVVPDVSGTMALTTDIQTAHSNRTELDKVTVGDHDVIVTGNPHAVTKTEVSLGNVTNVATSDVAYDDTSWNGNTDAATKNAIRDEINLIWDDVGANSSHASSDGKDHSDVVLNNAHRVVVTGNPHAVTKTDVSLGNVTDDKQVRNAASSFATDFISGTAITTHKILIESAAGSMRYGFAGSLPLTSATTTAINSAVSGLGYKTKRRMIYIETMTASDSYPICMVPVACTITEVTAQTLNGTFTYNLQERAKGTPGSGGTAVFSSAKLGYSTISTETSFTNSTLAAETWLYFVAASVSGTPPTHSWVTVEYTED